MEPSLEGIPRLLHFIWLGSSLPERVSLNIESFRKCNPGVEIRIWGDADFDWLQNRKIFVDAPTIAGKADIARC